MTTKTVPIADTDVGDRGPRTLPFAQLDAAGQVAIDATGRRAAATDALTHLADREIVELTLSLEALDVAEATRRLRSIAGGALRAGKTDKALAAKVLELAGPVTVTRLLTGE